MAGNASSQLERPSCGSCPYFNRGWTPGNHPALYGGCHVDPPGYGRPRKDEAAGFGGQLIARWPIVLDDSLCGRHPELRRQILLEYGPGSLG